MYALLLALVTLTVSPQSVNLNPAGQQAVTVTGATAPLTVTLDGRLVAAAGDASDGNRRRAHRGRPRGERGRRDPRSVQRWNDRRAGVAARHRQPGRSRL